MEQDEVGEEDDLQHYPADQAEENIEYQQLAWYSAPFGSTGITLLLLAAAVNLTRRAGRALIRLAQRLKLV